MTDTPNGGTVAAEPDIDIEAIVNNVADTLDGTVLILDEVNEPYSDDMRLHACIAALKNAREQLDPLLDAF